MRHHRIINVFLVSSILLGLAHLITAVLLVQKGGKDGITLLSLGLWCCWLILSIFTINAPLGNQARFRLLAGASLVFFMATLITVGQRTVNTEDGLATGNRILTAVSTVSLAVLTILYVRFRFAQLQVNREVGQGVFLQVKPQPAMVHTNEFWSRFPALAFKREGIRPIHHLAFELQGTVNEQTLGFFIPTEGVAKDLLLKELQTSWPGMAIEVLEAPSFLTTQAVTWVDLELKENDKFPLFIETEDARYQQGNVDRLSGLLSAIQPPDSQGQIGIQLLVRPAPAHLPESWQRRVNQIEVLLSRRGSRSSGNIEGTSRHTTTYGPQNVVQLQQERDALKHRIKMGTVYYEVILRIWATHEDATIAEQLKNKAVSLVQTQLAGMNTLQVSRRKGLSWEAVTKRPFSDRGGFIMTGRELEATFHMPTAETANNYPLLVTNKAVSLPPQASVIVSDTNHIAGYITGTRTSVPSVRIYGRYKRGVEQLYIGHGFQNTYGHLLGTGATGAGKSVLAQHIIFQDWFSGNGVLVLDPHGALIEDILTQIPFGGEENVLILDPESSTPFKYNICQIGKSFGLDKTVDALMEAIKVAMGVSWDSSVGMQQILRNAFILALASDPECDMVHVFHMLDPQKRIAALKKVRKTAVGIVKLAVTFWEEKFPSWDKPAQSRAVSAAERRIGVFIQSGAIRRTLGTRGESVDLEEALNSGKLILAPMGNLGEETKRLWSAILVREVIHTLMKRGRGNKCGTTLVFDEMKATIGTLGGYVQTIVEELRKYKAAGVFFAQSFSQLPQDVVLALKANCRTQIVMSTGADDAKIASEVLGGVRPEDIQNMPAYHAYAKLYADGAQEKACLIQLLPPKKKELNPIKKDHKLYPPVGIYHPETLTLPMLEPTATDEELTAFLNGKGSNPEMAHEVLRFLNSQPTARVEHFLWLHKNTLKWMRQVVRENPGLMPKKNRIRLFVNSAIGTPWWWSDYLFEHPKLTQQTQQTSQAHSMDIV